MFLLQSLQKEIAGHEPRVDDVIRRAEDMEGEPEINPQPIKKQRESLEEQWNYLKTATLNREKSLNQANEAQQYYVDASEAEAWIDEQQLYMIGDEKPKVRFLVQSFLFGITQKTQRIQNMQ